MQIVEQAINFPGCCALTGSSNGPFIQTGRPLDPKYFPQGGEQYVKQSYAIELGEAAGMVAPHTLAAANERIAQLEHELALATMDAETARAEADAMIVCVGPKLWGRAQHIRKNAGFDGRRKIDEYRKIMDGKIEVEA